MAYERYPWLDQEAAERLLRGEPVEPAGVDARSAVEARRLAAALDAARTPEAANDPLPLRGEEAALAAFRKARDGGAEEILPTAVRLGGAAPDTPVTPVGAGAAASRPGRWARPMRWGLAASLAGFAVGGVAVAAGTGVLPTPFGDDRAPLPGSSVSAPVSPGPVESGSVTGGSGAATPDGPQTGDGAVAPSSPGAEEPTGGADGGGTASPDGRDRSDKQGDGHSRDWDNDGDSRSEWYAKTLEACRDYRSGKLGEESRRQLESLAKGSDRVTRFCDRLLSGAPGSAGDGTSGDGDNSGDDDGDGDDGRGGNDDDGGGDPGKGWSDGGSTQGTNSLTAVPLPALSLSAAIHVL
ncbi:hypothetical protein ABZ532_07715 [Streptomyces sp. NPDC019396]|uniref:hypothetical protein n=1 Tax=Streptomyces sp. NPDC019396 TaxID=3154687 RepID=UPI0033D5751D